MTDELKKALHRFEQRTINAWVLSTEDSFTDRDRLATKKAFEEAKIAKEELVSLIKASTDGK